MQDASNYCTCLIASSSEDGYRDYQRQKRRPNSRSARFPRNSQHRSRGGGGSIQQTHHNSVAAVGTKLHREKTKLTGSRREFAKSSKTRHNRSGLHHRSKREQQATFARTKYSNGIEGQANIVRSSDNNSLGGESSPVSASGELCDAKKRGRKKQRRQEIPRVAHFAGSGAKKAAEAVEVTAIVERGRGGGSSIHRRRKHKHPRKLHRNTVTSSSDNSGGSSFREDSASLVVLYRGESKLRSSSPSCGGGCSYSARRQLPAKSASLESQVPGQFNFEPTTEAGITAAAAPSEDKAKRKNRDDRRGSIADDRGRIERGDASRIPRQRTPSKVRAKPVAIERSRQDKVNERHRGGDDSTRRKARRFNSKAEECQRPRRDETRPAGLGLLMQHLCGGDDSAVDPNDSRRLFPFQATRSGNLKIVPNQVVFESKKVSVLVADPRNAKVNVKAEQSRVLAEEVPRLELPASSTVVTDSTDQRRRRQQRSKLFAPSIPREIPDESTMMGDVPESCVSTIDDVPLSSLGFTTEQPIDWKNVTLPEKTDLYKEIARRITTYKNADCTVRIGNDEFHCHLLVLQSYSGFFDDKNVKEIDLTGSSVTSRVFSVIYDWMLSPTRESCQLLKRDNILEVFLAAQYLGIKELEEQCWAFIDNDELFREDTAFLLYLEARKIENTAVMELMLPRIMKFFLMLVSTKDFLELDVQELTLLLRSNYICVNSEMEVLMSAVRWLMHDWENRKQHLLEVMKCVRFGLIAPWQLVDVKRNPENPEFMELMSYPEVQQMVDDGLAYVIIKYWYGNQTEDYYHWIDLLGLTEPTNRNWAGEDKHYVTYREFLLYLEDYQRTKISEFRDKKLCKTQPVNLPKKDENPTQIPSAKPRANYQSVKAAESARPTNNSRPSKHMTTTTTDTPNSNNNNNNNTSRTAVQPSPLPCMMMPPEILSQYFGSIGRNGSKPASKPTHNGLSRTKN